MNSELECRLDVRNRRVALCCFFALLLMTAGVRHAAATAGFNVNMHGAKAMGMAMRYV